MPPEVELLNATEIYRNDTIWWPRLSFYSF